MIRAERKEQLRDEMNAILLARYGKPVKWPRSTKSTPCQLPFERPWADHLSCRRDAEGVLTFIAEPYGLDGKSLSDLARIAADGWSVEVWPWSPYNPLGTLMIAIRRKEWHGVQQISVTASAKETRPHAQ